MSNFQHLYNRTTIQLIKKLGINFPIIQAPMAGGATTPELIAAVSNAGALGSLGAGYMPAEAIKSAIHTIRKLTTKPFAVNLFIPNDAHASNDQLKQAQQHIEAASVKLGVNLQASIHFNSSTTIPEFSEQIAVVIEEKVPIFSFTFGVLEDQWIKALKENNTIIVGTATTLAEGLLLQQKGIDIIVAQGCEAGGASWNISRTS